MLILSELKEHGLAETLMGIKVMARKSFEKLVDPNEDANSNFEIGRSTSRVNILEKTEGNPGIDLRDKITDYDFVHKDLSPSEGSAYNQKRQVDFIEYSIFSIIDY